MVDHEHLESSSLMGETALTTSFINIEYFRVTSSVVIKEFQLLLREFADCSEALWHKTPAHYTNGSSSGTDVFREVSNARVLADDPGSSYGLLQH